MKVAGKSVVLLAFVLLTWCCSSPVNSKFAALCEIYGANVSKQISTDKKEVKISIAVQNELPDFYDSHFKAVMLAEPKKRYELFKSMAKKSSNIDWECAAAKRFYETEF